MSKTRIAFIGGGNMARSLIGGLVQHGFAPEQIAVSDPNAAQRDNLTQNFGVVTYRENAQAVVAADIVVLAVKPQVMKEVCLLLANKLQQPLIISIAAGIPSHALTEWLGIKTIVRCMPNTPALIGEGISGLYATSAVTAAQKDQADKVLAGAGQTVWLENEQQIDAVTAVSGSGPAYFFLLIEAMTAAGVKLGLSETIATQLAQATAQGAARMACQSELTAAQLRQQVTSPQGTTEAAINSFLDNQFMAITETALTAAANRSAELAKQFS